MNTKIVEEYTYHGLGYPVKLNNVRMYLYEGEWCPIINVEEVALAEYHRLIHVAPRNRTQANQSLVKRIEGVL